MASIECCLPGPATIAVSLEEWVAEDDPDFVFVLCDHPDAFGDAPLRAAERWPLAEVVVVDSEWGLSACRTRREVPAGWRIDEATACEVVRAIGDGRRPQYRPRTLTRGERVCEETFELSDWPRLDEEDPAVQKLRG